MYVGKKKVAPVFRHIIYKEKQPAPNGEFYLKVFDFYGNELISKRLNNGDVFVLPDPIEDDKLEFQEWSSTEQIIDGKITIDNNNVLIGAIGTPKSGLSEFDVEVTRNTGKKVFCKMPGNKNWGDGTSDDLLEHEYAEYGEYTITCDGNSLVRALFSSVASSGDIPVNALKRARLSERITTKYSDGYLFWYAKSLEYVTFPKTDTQIIFSGNGFENSGITSLIFPSNYTSFGDRFCSNCFRLKTVLLPYGFTRLNYPVFYNNYAMSNIVIPNTITYIDDENMFGNCAGIKELIVNVSSNVYLMNLYALEKLVLGENVKLLQFSCLYGVKEIIMPKNSTFVASQFYYCYSLQKVKFPKNISGKLPTMFGGAQALQIIDFTEVETIPILNSTSGLISSSNTNPLLKIVVPDALYDDWIVATNWTVNAQYIYKASEVNI